MLWRRKSLTKKQIIELQEKRGKGELIKTLMKDYDLSKTSVYRYLTSAPDTEVGELD
ncbi:helix-turn-helix domain-containing protein [Thiofilum flexile]|uniref:helix-turn-helix domain-containing protein n=1 Tax=Thiofilum flexile TaxID=125627 RepID=UPI0003744988|nr:helix-turn-helix domain-containing protein [Thiofilum flexile]